MPSFGEKADISFLLCASVPKTQNSDFFIISSVLFESILITPSARICLHWNFHRIPLITEGDIWWASLGENVGMEINGKGGLFDRPVIILKKFSRNFYFVIPASSKLHTGPWYFPYKDRDLDVVACLHQARSIDSRRISNKLGKMKSADFTELKKTFQELYNPVSYLG